MPLYSYTCPKGHDFDRFLKLEDYAQEQTCDCGLFAKKVIKPTMVNCDIQPWDHYISPATGKPITSYKQRKDDMERAGCVDYDPGVREDNTKRVKARDLQIEKDIDVTVERTFDAMPSRKKETLENELKHLDLGYERSTVSS